MAKLTINRVLVLSKMVRERVNELRTLRHDVAKKERFFSDGNKVVEPQYDVKLVDKKIVALEKFLMLTDMEIKTSNACVEIELDFDIDTLLAPLE